MLKLYRIAKKQFAEDLSGKGAYIVGGRWNSSGRFVVYTSSSVSLSMLEVLVHVSMATCPDDLFLTTMVVPDNSIEELSVDELDATWNSFPNTGYSQEIGDRWLMKRKSLLLKVPSVINPKESNYLINPQHPLFNKVKVECCEKWSFDMRLYRLMEL